MSTLRPPTSPNVGDLLPGFATEAEVAQALSISKRTLRRWRNERTGPPQIKKGRRIFYRREAVAAWLQASEQKPVRPLRSHPGAALEAGR